MAERPLSLSGLTADELRSGAGDPAMLAEDEVTIAVQVKGKLRDTLVAPRGLDRAAAEAVEREPRHVRVPAQAWLVVGPACQQHHDPRALDAGRLVNLGFDECSYFDEVVTSGF